MTSALPLDLLCAFYSFASNNECIQHSQLGTSLGHPTSWCRMTVILHHDCHYLESPHYFPTRTPFCPLHPYCLFELRLWHRFLYPSVYYRTLLYYVYRYRLSLCLRAYFSVDSYLFVLNSYFLSPSWLQLEIQRAYRCDQPTTSSLWLYRNVMRPLEWSDTTHRPFCMLGCILFMINAWTECITNVERSGWPECTGTTITNTKRLIHPIKSLLVVFVKTLRTNPNSFSPLKTSIANSRYFFLHVKG